MNDEDRGSTIDDEATGAGMNGEDGGARAAGFIPLSAIRPSRRPGTGSDVPPLPARSAASFDLTAIREKLATMRGRQYWRSLDELAGTEEFQMYLEKEFPRQAPTDMEPLSRREFLRVMGAGLALAGLAGCSYQPAEHIVPYVKQPEELVPGKPLFFATAFTLGGYAMGLLAESHEGRPTKLEGNADHPASLGATSAIAQASLLGLYDPDRSQAVRQMGDVGNWDTFLGAMATELAGMRARGGAGVRLLTGTVTSPTLAAQIRAFLAAYPAARWHQHEPAGRDNIREGARMAFGAVAQPIYRFDRADRILSLDADFLLEDPGSVRYAREFIDGRRVRANRTAMNRLYVVESMMTLTGAMADHRVPIRSSDVEAFALGVASALGVAGVSGGAAPAGVPPNFIPAVVRDLQGSRGRSIVVAGRHQPPIVHALAHAMNEALGNVGQTVSYVAPVEADATTNQAASLRTLVDDMRAGRVDTLLILGTNPVFTAPADLNFNDALQKVRLRIHHGLYDDETGVQCQWHLPESHYLEAWSDARAFDGTTSIVQPLILPLYETRSSHELLSMLLGQGDRAGYDIVQGYWRGQRPGAAFDDFWQNAVHDGVIAGTASPPQTVAVRAGFAAAAPPPPRAGVEVVFRPDPSIWDGRFANNSWLQELPKPITKLTWDNAALMSPATAEQNKLGNGDYVELSYRGRTLLMPVFIVPGHAANSITAYLGYGRTHTGKVGTGAGFNVYTLRTADAPDIETGVQIRAMGGHYDLATTQHHFSMHGRDLIKVGTIDEFAKSPMSPAFMQSEDANEPHTEMHPHTWPSDRHGDEKPGAAPDWEGQGYNDRPIPAWGMLIDNNACIGCNACVLACQSENNIATVGKDQVMNNRMMHWIRIDTYYRGEDLENPEAYFEPLTCMQCEKAPCEPVCPVEATTHSAEGINEMTYNRCVGTRYCSNNCPYKVRRFNFLQYSDQKTPTIQLMRNPDVTVRSRGVMEKCNYCVQRINEARIQAEKEDRPIHDGDVVVACQQACPTQAIFFGDINDKTSHGGRGSQVRQLKEEPLNYALLTELNTHPRTTYLARLRNPNPDLPAAVEKDVEYETQGG